jgi:hypothetical protein
VSWRSNPNFLKEGFLYTFFISILPPDHFENGVGTRLSWRYDGSGLQLCQAKNSKKSGSLLCWRANA